MHTLFLKGEWTQVYFPPFFPRTTFTHAVCLPSAKSILLKGRTFQILIWRKSFPFREDPKLTRHAQTFWTELSPLQMYSFP